VPPGIVRGNLWTGAFLVEKYDGKIEFAKPTITSPR
jgi:hypothetical protein